MHYCRPITRLIFCLLMLCFVAEGISAATKKPPLKPININTANSEELQQVPGIGPATAEKILQMRKSYGAFKSVDDLLSIEGLGKKRLEKMRKYLTVTKIPAGKELSPRSRRNRGSAQLGSSLRQRCALRVFALDFVV